MLGFVNQAVCWVLVHSIKPAYMDTYLEFTTLLLPFSASKITSDIKYLRSSIVQVICTQFFSFYCTSKAHILGRPAAV